MPEVVLLTGATGFVGAFALEALLKETRARVICLVRCDSPRSGKARVLATSRRYGLDADRRAGRITVEPADLSLPSLGLSEARRAALARKAGAICHCAAEVNWAAGYRALRPVNVLGVRELLRLAVTGVPKPFIQLSSLAVCYSTLGTSVVEESDDALPGIGGLHFGYAQSKCVGEALVREAGRRGLPVSVLRPALISNHSRTGAGNSGDLLSLLFKGCVQMGCAPDLDWWVDCCPVDHIAAVIACLIKSPEPGSRVLHLRNPGQRHWREAVLWMNLSGYPVRLVPYREWLEHFNKAMRREDFALRPLRGFFFHQPDIGTGEYLPELFEEKRRRPIDAAAGRRFLKRERLDCPPLNGRYFNATFDALVAEGFLPRSRQYRAGRDGDPDAVLTPAFFNRAWPRSQRPGRVRRVERLNEGSENSIVSEMTVCGGGGLRGLFHCRLEIAVAGRSRPAFREVMVKLKPADQEIVNAGILVARLCDPALGEAYARFGRRLGFARCHLREPAIYEQADARFRRHLPECLGVVRDEPGRRWGMILEYAPELARAPEVSSWTPEKLECAIQGLAEFQSVWHGREPALRRLPWMTPAPTVGEMREMTPLWLALAEFSRRDFDDWSGGDLYSIRMRLIQTIEEWWPRLERMPRTLIHNDFNPRNVGFRDAAGGPRLCVYDWELAACGAPQHDLAELLCFVLPATIGRPDLLRWVSLHHRAFEIATGQRLDRDQWLEGFRLSLCDLMVQRFPLYALPHRFRRQAFLGRVVRTWRRLHKLLSA